MTTLTRRRGSSSREEEDEPRGRRRTSSREEPDEEPRSRRGRSSRSDEDEDRPSRSSGSRRRSSSTRGDDDDTPRRGEKKRARRSGTGGWSSFDQKRRANSSFADEFKPDSGVPTLIKVLDEAPFDVYNQHFINELPKGDRKSFVCHDDEYFEDYKEGCPLCEIGESASTYSLFNILDLTNPRKPEVKVWKTSVTVSDKLERLAKSDRTSPLNREDIYFDVEVTKTKNKTEWDIKPVKERDLEEDYGLEPFTGEELDEFEKSLFTDRSAITQVDDYDALAELADGLDD